MPLKYRSSQLPSSDPCQIPSSIIDFLFSFFLFSFLKLFLSSCILNLIPTDCRRRHPIAALQSKRGQFLHKFPREAPGHFEHHELAARPLGGYPDTDERFKHDAVTDIERLHGGTATATAATAVTSLYPLQFLFLPLDLDRDGSTVINVQKDFRSPILE